jgi:DNA-binding transcriptional LysR family regulator
LIDPEHEAVEVEISSCMRSDNGEVSLDWALAGCGLIMKSWVDVAADIVDGRLVHVLPEWKREPAPVCALFPTNRLVPTRVRLFLDAMAERLRPLSQTGDYPDGIEGSRKHRSTRG